MNQIPDKIWINPLIDLPKLSGVIDKDSVQYTRTDVLIEKAEKYLKDKFIEDVSVLAGGPVHIGFSTAIKNFINYIKGE